MHISTVTTQEAYQACLSIRMQVFVHEQKVPLEIEVDQYEQEAVHFLLELAGVPVATGRYRVTAKHLKFERIATLSTYRGQGIGKALMLHMQEHARKHHPEHTPMMHAQSEVIAFYQNLGWISEGDQFEEAGIKHQKMFLPTAGD